MFICTRRPEEEQFPADLTQLGFKYENGEFVEIDPPHAHFEYFHTDSDKMNDRRKEAMHECVRQQVASELEKFGIKYLYLHGRQGTEVSQDKPKDAHVRLLATEVSKLRRKKDVIIVVGEAGGDMQDAGIWAYRIVSRQGGTENGSAVGMAGRIAAYAQANRADDPADEFERVISGTRNMSLAEIGDNKDDTTPGLIILNPGQLRYSHREQKPMTQPTWLARLDQTTIDQPYVLNEKYNLVPGHEHQHSHIVTCFEHVLPYILRDDARVYLAIIGDSAKSTIDYLDQLFLNKTETGLASQLEAVAIVQGNEQPQDIISEQLRTFLANNGKKWMECPRLPFGRLVQTPGTGNIVDIAEYPFVPPQRTIRHNEESGAEGKPEEDETEWDKPDEDAATIVDDVGASQPGPEDDAASVTSTGAVQGESRMEDSIISISEAQHENPEADATYVDVKDEAYEEYAKMEVLCPTFSAGDCDGIAETVFPKVMDKVLELFWQKKEAAENMEALKELRKANAQQTQQAPAA